MEIPTLQYPSSVPFLTFHPRYRLRGWKTPFAVGPSPRYGEGLLCWCETCR